VLKWLDDLGVKTLYIEPGSPGESGYLESFNGKLRDERLDYSGYMGNQIHTRLEEAGLIERCEVNTGRRGRAIVLYQPTAKGWEHLTSVLQADVAKPRGKGGFEHQFWQHNTAVWYGAQHPQVEVVIEDQRLGKAVDVAVYFPDGRRIAIEIAIGTAKKPHFELANIEADYAAGYDQVIVAAHAQEDLDRIKEAVIQELGEDISQRIEWRRLREFLEQHGNDATEVLSDQQSLDLSAPAAPKVMVKTKNESGL